MCDVVSCASVLETEGGIFSLFHKNFLVNFQGNKGSLANKEMVMEHDAVLDEATLLPFLQSVLKQAGFIKQKPIASNFQNLVTETHQHHHGIFNIFLPEDTSRAVFKAIADCKRLRHSMKQIKPVLSFLIHGGRNEAKLLAKKFSTKLPIKRCRAILTIYCLPPKYLNGRAPRTNRFQRIMTN